MHHANPRAAARPAWALAALSLSMLLSSLGTSIANVALPALQDGFGASFGQVQWVVLAYLLAATTLVVSAGRLGDLLGRRRLLLAGLAAFTVASALCAAAPGLPVLIAARAAQGVGAALMMALTLAVVAGTVPAARTGSAMGLLGTTSAIGTALGPALGGALIAAAGWRAVFLVNVPLGLLALLLALRCLPTDGPATPAERRFDVGGTILLFLALGAYALATTTGRVPGAALLGIAVASTALFVRHQARVAAPLVRPTMLRDPGLRAGLVTSALISTVMMATLVVGPFHLSRGLGLGPAAVGLLMSAGPAVVVLAGIPAGRLVDRVGAARLTTAGLVVMGGGTLALAVAPVRLGAPGYVAPIVLLTLGYAVVQTANTTSVMAGAGPEGRGVTSGLLTLSRNLGLITGASVMGAVLALGAGSGHLSDAAPRAVAAGTHLTFALATALVGVALGIASGAGRAGLRTTARGVRPDHTIGKGGRDAQGQQPEARAAVRAHRREREEAGAVREAGQGDRGADGQQGARPVG
ncbi:MAG: MFS transporter [Thermoleophilia bacterium]